MNGTSDFSAQLSGEQGQSGESRILLSPLGDRALLARFGDSLDGPTNHRAVLASQIIKSGGIPGVLEVCPTLVSVFVRYDPAEIPFMDLCSQVRMALARMKSSAPLKPQQFSIPVKYGGLLGPDLEESAARCSLSVSDFIKAHSSSRLHVLATGFAPGFVYCGLHEPGLHIPRRTRLHTRVAPGSVLFAAGQTAITATQVPTGWNVIGHTDFSNFDAAKSPPTTLRPGDEVSFVPEIAD